MDLRHARTFVTVAELGTVSKAALHLRIAQPALSRQIRGLEQELGLKLFRFESRAPHTLLAMAESGHGVAIIPSVLRTHRYILRIVGVTYRGTPLREPLTIFWDKRRPLPRYASAFCKMLAEHVRQVFPISRPSDVKKSPR